MYGLHRTGADSYKDGSALGKSVEHIFAVGVFPVLGAGCGWACEMY